MAHIRRPTISALVLLGGLVATAGWAAPEPAPALSAEGGSIVYTARPGDTPARVASMLGIAPADFAAFLRVNGIADAARVPAGFRYRVPNPLAAQVEALQARIATLARDAESSAARAGQLDTQLLEARAASAGAAADRARLDRLERLWPFAEAGLVLLALAAAAAGATARSALRRRAAAERHARELDDALEQKRRTNLAERQESGRRLLALEARIRELERPRGPSALASVK